MHRKRHPKQQVVSDALRRELAPSAARDRPQELTPHESALRPGFDPAGFNQPAGELEEKDSLDFLI